jgi:hypothetical protein
MLTEPSIEVKDAFYLSQQDENVIPAQVFKKIDTNSKNTQRYCQN